MAEIIQQQLRIFQDSVNKLSIDSQALQERPCGVERHVSEQRRAAEAGGGQPVPQQTVSAPGSGAHAQDTKPTVDQDTPNGQPNEVGATSAIVDDAALLQREFNSLKDSLSRVNLPEEPERGSALGGGQG